MSRSPEALPRWATRTLPESVVLAAGVVLGVVLRSVQLATSIGTIDASNWLRHVLYVEKFGVLRSYAASEFINHPALALELALWSKRVGSLFGLQFFDAFRIVTSAADLVTAVALYALARSAGIERAAGIALLFFLSPASIFVSAFHCNSDPVMVMFLVLALLMTVEQRALPAGLLIGAALGIKIIAAIALPLLLFGIPGWKPRLRFLLGAAGVSAIVFLPPLFVSGSAMLRNIFGYTGVRGPWGIPFLLKQLSSPAIAPRDAGVLLTLFLLLALLTLWATEGRVAIRDGAIQAKRLLRATALAFLAVLVLAPGFGPQYLHWILPFPALLFGSRAAILLHALISVYLFAIYTAWSGEWPWLWAKADVNPPWLGIMGLVVWIACAVSAAIVARSLYGRTAAA